jgi:isochorismate synthase
VDLDLLWDPPDGPAFAGAGRVLELTAAHLRAGVEGAWPRPVALADLDLDAVEDPAPRLFGGLAFAPGRTEEAPWLAFGDGGFVLPRLRYARQGERAFLDLTLESSSWSGAGRDAARAELDLALGALATAVPPAHQLPGPFEGLLELSAARWSELVREVTRGLRAGQFEKVVLARRSQVDARHPFDPIEVLDRLRESALGCTRFAFRRGQATFLGATPERLVARRGLAVQADALAGSSDRLRPPRDHPPSAGDSILDDAGAAAALLASAKDTAEHGHVVREIALRLGPHCERLDVPAQPSVRRLRHLLHLHTRIEGCLREPRHVLDLVGLLHPTPAVGGVPRSDALRWILEHEPAPRGWYAGPVGWFDEKGDGDFSVALRSALIWGRTAWLWAGAGIVLGSEAVAEYAETALKQRAMLDALGMAG